MKFDNRYHSLNPLFLCFDPELKNCFVLHDKRDNADVYVVGGEERRVTGDA